MLIEFAGPSAADPDNGWANTSRLLDCYREGAGDGGIVLKQVLGVEQYTGTLSGGVADATSVDGIMYLAMGGKLYALDEDGNEAELGDIRDSENTTISGNNGVVTVAAGGKYYVYDTADGSFSEPAKGAFNVITDAVFFGDRTIQIEAGARVAWSEVADAKTIDGLSFATTGSRDDNNLRALPIAGVLWIFKETSIEKWQSTTDGIAPIVGATVEPGLRDRRLLTAIPNGAFFIASDGKAYLVRGSGMQPVSNPAVETSIATQGPLNCAYYQDEGHEMCVITFDDREAWVFDASTGEWHERRDFMVDASVVWNNRFFVGKRDVGLYELKRNRTGFDGQLISTAIGRTVANGGRYFTVSRMHLEAKVGSVSRSRVGDDRESANLTLNVSKDHGNTYGQTKTKSLGYLGEYNREIVWRALGRMKQFTPKIAWSEADDVTISAKATLEMVA